MKTSAKWLNDYLDPPATPEEQADILTRAGFPVESSEPVEHGDTRQDIETTSNRGDCVCHLGLAREIAAMSARTLRPPSPKVNATGPFASSIISVVNHEKLICPRYTARVIRGVTVGPSPDWIADRLRARGDIPRNTLVDATNFVLFELGQPTHVFDLSTIHGRKIVIRLAQPGESFLPIGEGAKPVTLSRHDLVIADADRPIALAGVKGGALTAVNNQTTDIIVEAATFQPLSVRNTSRRHQIFSDSSYRFERGVHPAHIDFAADRLCQLILELCGGELGAGIIEDGNPIPPPVQIELRPDRCRKLLGIAVTDEQIQRALDRLGFAPRRTSAVYHCTVPVHRLDITREIDLVEEVGRFVGLDAIPIRQSLEVRVTPPQPTEVARQALHDTLVGMGYIETITHSLVSETDASLFVPVGSTVLRVDDDRARSEPVLRPSILPSLLRVRKHNEDNGVNPLKLFESASTFCASAGRHDETVRTGLLADMLEQADGLRPLRGELQRLAELLLGSGATVELSPADCFPWLAAQAAVLFNSQPVGWIGVIAPTVKMHFGLERPLLAAEITPQQFFCNFPPETEAQPLPAFPSIERDLSAILADDDAWHTIDSAVRSLNLSFLESIEFVTVFRSKQIGAGRKSLTLRLRFRAADRTLTHNEVDPQMTNVMEHLKRIFNAEIRS